MLQDGSLLYVYSNFAEDNFRLVRNNGLPYLEGGVDTVIDSDLSYVVAAKINFLSNGNIALVFTGTDETDTNRLGVLYYTVDGNSIPAQAACGVVVAPSGRAHRRVIWFTRKIIPLGTGE